MFSLAVIVLHQNPSMSKLLNPRGYLGGPVTLPSLADSLSARSVQYSYSEDARGLDRAVFLIEHPRLLERTSQAREKSTGGNFVFRGDRTMYHSPSKADNLRTKFIAIYSQGSIAARTGGFPSYHGMGWCVFRAFSRIAPRCSSEQDVRPF